METNETIIDVEGEPSSPTVKLTTDNFTVEEQNYELNGKSGTVQYINPGNSISAIIYNTNTKKYLFVEEFHPTIDGKTVNILYVPVGDAEINETLIKSTVTENIGYKIDGIEHITDYYVSPRNSKEISAIFYVTVSEKIDEIVNDRFSIVEVDKLALNGKLVFDSNDGSGQYQVVDSQSLIAINWIESNQILKDIADIITQAKLKTF